MGPLSGKNGMRQATAAMPTSSRMRFKSPCINLEDRCRQWNFASARLKALHNKNWRVQCEPAIQTLFRLQSQYNDLSVVQVPESVSLGPVSGCRLLVVGERGTAVYSIYKDNDLLISPDFYWQHMALIAESGLPGIIGILGLGTGTVARIIHNYWPDKKMYGWELDAVILDAGRQYMGLSEVEEAGTLVSHVGDAFSDSAIVESGFAGLIVDVFANGKIPDTFKSEEIWKKVKERLKTDGRLIVNVGSSLEAGQVNILSKVFGGKPLYVKQIARSNCLIANFDASLLKEKLPSDLQHTADDWKLHK